ncbi:cytochrome p450 [Lichtheimia corymbifera JMRC:FSU:9682]|uniref:Cytochrome p450 n=1 Tax=Lichtheimia corymbifera JMRC:FSU:9682 TaxID=1263082 RepID=A0A068RX26_9FUNG|nr:cytochrome p450 [Lichtheimia corymbifera JMRC:FSU:9682]
MLTDISNQAEKLVNILATENNIDPYQHLLRFSLDDITFCCFGKRTTSINDPLFKQASLLAEYVKESSKLKYVASQYLPVLSFIGCLLGHEKEFAKHTESRDTWILNSMMEAYNDGKECIATVLMEAADAGEIDEISAVVSLSDIIGGGMETTAVTLAWAFGILSVEQEVQRKIQQELDHFIDAHKRMPVFTDREEFPYMIAVQKECMRFRPTTTIGLPHEAAEDIVWHNKIIPKGATIVTNMTAMHMNPDLYPEPYAFRPERFLDKPGTFTASAKSKIENRDQYNFGWGR